MNEESTPTQDRLYWDGRGDLFDWLVRNDLHPRRTPKGYSVRCLNHYHDDHSNSAQIFTNDLWWTCYACGERHPLIKDLGGRLLRSLTSERAGYRNVNYIGSPWNLHAKLLKTYLQPFLPPLDGVSYLVIIRFIFHRASSFRRGTPIGQQSHSVKFAMPMGSIDAFLSRVEKNPWPLAMRAYLEPRSFWRSRKATLIEPLLSWQEYRQLRSLAQPVEQYLDGWESGRPVIIGS